jgi:uncharacterized protein (TIGR04562 family)
MQPPFMPSSLNLLGNEQATPTVPLVNTHPGDDALALHWETLSALVSGTSSIDLASVPITSQAEALRFIQAYGYHWADAHDRDLLQRLLNEAIVFVETQLLDQRCEPALGDMALSVPTCFKATLDVPTLLLAASGDANSVHLQRWACALLKVLHVLIHIDNSAYWHYADLAHDQLSRTFKRVLGHHPSTGDLVLCAPQGSAYHLPLYTASVKSRKTRTSLLIKLLSKKANMMDEMDDLIGLRLVTHSAAHVLLALHLLHEHHLITFSNINPNRSRNNLIELSALREAYQSLAATVDTEAQPWEHWLALFGSITLPTSAASFKAHNPASAAGYRALHVTTRYPLLVPTPAVHQRVRRVFFPFELQLTDQASYGAAQLGDNAHHAYKRRQLKRARRRVLGALLPKHFKA